MGDDSGTGVAFTRDPNTGEKVLFGEYLTNAQGEDVVAGIRTPQPIAQMRDGDARGLRRVRGASRERLERHYRDVQDLEFTIERGRLYMLQTRSGKRTARGGREDRRGHGRRGHHHQGGGARAHRAGPGRPAAARPVRPGREAAGAARIAKGLNASPGAAVGAAVFDADRAVEWVARGEQGRPRARRDLARTTSTAWPSPGRPDRPRRRDLARRGRRAPDRQAVRRRLRGARRRLRGRAPRAPIGRRLRGGRLDQPRRLDRRGVRRRAADGRASASRSRRSSRRSWAGPTRSAAWRSGPTPTSPRRRPWPAATAPRASASAAPSTCSARASAWRSCAARSSSRCRRRAPRRRRAAGEALDAEETAAVARVRRRDGRARGRSSRATSRASSRRWTACRSSSASSTRRSTSSCPTSRTQLVKVTQAPDAGRDATRRTRELLATVESLHEQNPMLGLRGCRLGLMIPDFVKIQTRAILNAADRGQEGGRRPASPRS